ncbi:hypothetical protein G6L28_04500 [Agrobacterium larrymoorei]|uniref:hypothetical protein n=1 Tax=Agrobacterium larrymoorei TaxID=160699 RepID=UPI001573EA1C|nr:hypothetical protein [Agrobacterium larrymoorei]NTJ41861.1 hypothetical protein [Agrobacterium larrymoorei]
MTEKAQHDFSRLPSPVALAREKRRLVACAKLRNVSLFQSVPETLRHRIKSSPRLSHRLYGILVAELGQPTLSSVGARNFHLMPELELERVSLLLGLSYDFALRGGAIRGAVLESVGTFCSAETVAKALHYAAGFPLSFPPTDLEPITETALLCNGWSLLRLWAGAERINPAWRICDAKTVGATLGSVHRNLACELATVILADATLHGQEA